MSDLIDRQAAIDALCSVCGVDCDKSEFVYDGKQEDQVILCPEHYVLTQLPSAQPEPDIIACGDCKHWICHDRRCGYWNHGVKPLDWCCHGERRTDE